MRILVIGAAGRTGALVVEQALERGPEVTALARRAVPGRHAMVVGDATDPAVLGKAVQGQDAVVMAVGSSAILRGTTRSFVTVRGHRVALSRHVVRVWHGYHAETVDAREVLGVGGV
jgi:uncharacterized protein YbjT (DUF2867 family)